MRYCFDTSALNQLHQDAAQDAIAKALLDTGTVRVSAYNVLEAAKTNDDSLRLSLVRLLRRLSDGKRSLDRPNTLARSAARSYAGRSPDGKATITANADPDLDRVWTVLNEPEVLDENARREVAAWAERWEDDYDHIAAGARERFQSLIAKYPHSTRPTTAFTLRSYTRNIDQVFELLVGPIYELEVGRKLSRAEFDETMHEPIWSLYLGGYAYALHTRSVQVNNYSRKRNAGGIDLGQAVYLRFCDVFITNDHKQYRALRFLNQFARASGHGAEVLPYNRFRQRLLPFE